MLSFAIASFVAGIAGCLLSYRQGIITWDSFAAFLGLTLVSTAYLAGVTSVYGGVQAGIIATGGIVFYLSAQWIDLSGDIFVVISGVLVIVTLIRNPEGLAAGGHELADKFAAWRQRRGVVATTDASPTATDAGGDRDAVAAAPPVATVRTAPGPDAPTVLEVEHVTVQYGGVVAVDDLSLRVPAGGIVGLIGPNGAGKTSAVDAITGFTKATGAVLLDGTRIDSAPVPPTGAPRPRSHLPGARAVRRPQRRGERQRRGLQRQGRRQARRRATFARPRRHHRPRAPATPATSARDNASSCPSHERARPTRRSSSSTNRPRASTPPRAAGSATGSATSASREPASS